MVIKINDWGGVIPFVNVVLRLCNQLINTPRLRPRLFSDVPSRIHISVNRCRVFQATEGDMMPSRSSLSTVGRSRRCLASLSEVI